MAWLRVLVKSCDWTKRKVLEIVRDREPRGDTPHFPFYYNALSYISPAGSMLNRFSDNKGVVNIRSKGKKSATSENAKRCPFPLR